MAHPLSASVVPVFPFRLLTTIIHGLAMPEALRLGVACGSADALTISGGRITLDEVERLAAATVVRPL